MTAAPHRSSPSHFAPRRAAASAFTLIEMVTSCVILSLIMLALGYGLKLALLSTQQGATMATNSLEAADLVERVTDDLNEGMNFTERTSQSVTFTVPDRGTDGTPDKIRYTWWPTGGNIVIPGTSSSGSGSNDGGDSDSGGGLIGGLLGTVGGLLGGGGSGTSDSSGSGSGTSGSGDITIPVPAYTFTRQVNDVEIAVLGRDVRQFNLHYLTRTMTAPPAAAAAPADRVLLENDVPLLAGTGTFPINFDCRVAEIFTPSSQGAIYGSSSFSITRIALLIRANGTPYDGLLKLSIRRAAGNTLTAETQDTLSFAEVSLNSSDSWVEFPFANANNLNPNTRYAFVLEGVSGASGTYFATIGYSQGGVGGPSNTTMLWTTDRWATTSGSTSNSLRYRIYGTTSP